MKVFIKSIFQYDNYFLTCGKYDYSHFMCISFNVGLVEKIVIPGYLYVYMLSSMLVVLKNVK